jgi:hypothetical protein
MEWYDVSNVFRTSELNERAFKHISGLSLLNLKMYEANVMILYFGCLSM